MAGPGNDSRRVQGILSEAGPRRTFPKRERLCGRTNINNLIEKGRFGEVPGGMKFRYVTGTGSGQNRLMISVPKRNFKRAVRRNLLKRRIRESYRLQKSALNGTGTDILIIYSAKEILPYRDIYEAVGRIMAKLNGRISANDSGEGKTEQGDREQHTDNEQLKTD